MTPETWVMTSHVKIYGDTSGRWNGKGKGPEETLSVLNSRKIKKASVIKAGGGGGGVRRESIREMESERKAESGH